MLYITYLALSLYSLPLLALGLAAAMSGLFATESLLVKVAGVISATFLKQIWETFGTLVVPLITAFSVPIREVNRPVPGKTLVLISILAAGFLVSVSMLGIVSSYENQIKHFGKDLPQSFTDVTQSYIKGYLTYFGLTLGISLKKP